MSNTNATTSKRRAVSETFDPHNFHSLVDLSHGQLYSQSSLLELHHSRSLTEVPSVTLAEWREARMRHEVFDPESDHSPVKYPPLRKDFHRERKGRAYCAHCGKMVKTKVGKALNTCCLGSMFAVLLLCPILVVCAWIPLVWIDSQSQKVVCSKCDHEIGRHIPKKPREIKRDQGNEDENREEKNECNEYENESNEDENDSNKDKNKSNEENNGSNVKRIKRRMSESNLQH